MEKIKWCKEQKQGIKLIEPNENLSEEYYKNAEETFRITNQIKNSGSNMWLATQKYYVVYFCAYSLLMKIGIKCEIHTCTIEVIKILEKNNIIDFEFSKILEKDKELRIENQYYLKNKSVDYNPKKLREILLNIRNTTLKLERNKIEKIRKILEIN